MNSLLQSGHDDLVTLAPILQPSVVSEAEACLPGWSNLDQGITVGYIRAIDILAVRSVSQPRSIRDESRLCPKTAPRTDRPAIREIV